MGRSGLGTRERETETEIERQRDEKENIELRGLIEVTKRNCDAFIIRGSAGT